ncbi:MAG: phage tail sheath subtilisin-like domain-containing protein [Anaerolineae bacterium]|nr:phage tail sheath subtilisin-like domain-containing protein [Anaerolineae bacterium]
MPTYQTPGVYREDVFLPPADELRTGVPALLGYAEAGEVNTPQTLTLWSQFEEKFGAPPEEGYLAGAVRGFFENGGEMCAVVRLDDTLSPQDALRKGLEALEPLNTIDLVCAPDIMVGSDQEAALQQEVLEHCENTGDRFAILDSPQGAAVDEVLSRRRELRGTNGALYYPWIKVLEGEAMAEGFIPPCGHVAGVYARSDQRIGVHKAPANEVLEGVLDLEADVTDADQGRMNPVGVNCLRAFPGRGIRVWGARTLSNDSAWTYINVRRLFLTAGRWIERNMTGVVFEPHDQRLWARIVRELTAYFNDLFRRGALKGQTPQEAFYVKCNAETNPPEVRDAGMIVTEIGLAPTVPGEFVAVRIIHGASGVTITTEPTEPAAPPAPGTRGGRRRIEDLMPSLVRITHVEYNPSGPDLAGEYVLVKNLGGVPVDLTKWTLNDLSRHIFEFPHFLLAPGASVRVWTKRGNNTSTDLYWGRGVAVWSNIGDRAYLRDSKGKLVYVYTYTPIDALLASINQSTT